MKRLTVIGDYSMPGAAPMPTSEREKQARAEWARRNQLQAIRNDKRLAAYNARRMARGLHVVTLVCDNRPANVIDINTREPIA